MVMLVNSHEAIVSTNQTVVDEITQFKHIQIHAQEEAKHGNIKHAQEYIKHLQIMLTNQNLSDEIRHLNDLKIIVYREAYAQCSKYRRCNYISSINNLSDEDFYRYERVVHISSDLKKIAQEVILHKAFRRFNSNGTARNTTTMTKEQAEVSMGILLENYHHKQNQAQQDIKNCRFCNTTSLAVQEMLAAAQKIYFTTINITKQISITNPYLTGDESKTVALDLSEQIHMITPLNLIISTLQLEKPVDANVKINTIKKILQHAEIITTYATTKNVHEYLGSRLLLLSHNITITSTQPEIALLSLQNPIQEQRLLTLQTTLQEALDAYSNADNQPKTTPAEETRKLLTSVETIKKELDKLTP